MAPAAAEDVGDPFEAPDVGDGAGADEVPGLAGRGGAFAAGGGEAAGAGRAGGTVGIANLGVSLGAWAALACVAEALGVAEVAGDAAGRLASAGVADAGRVASAARAVGMPGAPEPAARAGADPDTVAGAVVAPRVVPDAEPGDAELDGAVADAEPVGATPDTPPAGTAPPLGTDAVPRGAVPGCAGCEDEDVDLVAAGLLEARAVGSVAEAVVDLRALAAEADDADVAADADAVPEPLLPEAAGAAADEPVRAADAVVDPEVGVSGAADRVGGIGASPDPRSAASNIGDAHVPEYALSVNVDPGVLPERASESADVEAEAFAAVGFAPCPDVAAGTAGIPNPAGDLSGSVAAADLAAAAPCPRVAAP